MTIDPVKPSRPSNDWRQTHLGEVFRRATERFEHRVGALMAADDTLSLMLARLATDPRLTASHIHITRHLPREGCSLSALARRAGISKQAMAKLVDPCIAWGLVQRAAEPRDARAIRISFTEAGLGWLDAYERAVTRAETEFAETIGLEVATVAQLGLEVYAI